MIVFDIETAALPFDEVKHFMPLFDCDVGEFDPYSVKIGNLKDPVKIEEKIESARFAHAAEKANVERRLAEHATNWHERCALSPVTGTIVAIGAKRDSSNEGTYISLVDEEFDERDLIQWAWNQFADVGGVPYIGHNIFGFDLPFLVRRSWLLEIDVPASIRNGRYWSPIFIDLMEQWGCGSREFVSLDTLAKACGLPGKPDGVNGGDFAKLLETDRPKAIEYLRGDLEMTWAVASRMQIA
jgi:hypothetical protein